MYHLFWSHSHVQVPVYWIVLLLSTTYCLLVNYTITSHLMSWEHCWVYLVKRCVFVCVCMCVCLSVCGERLMIKPGIPEGILGGAFTSLR